MNFNPKLLPATVYEAFKQGSIAWVFVIQTAIEVGITNADRLTDIAFYLHHPDLEGRPLKLGETEYIEAWKNFRRLIKPLIPAFGKKSTKPITSNLRQFGLNPTNVEPYKVNPNDLEWEYQSQKFLGDLK